MKDSTNTTSSRALIYGAMIALLVAIFVGAYRGAEPVYLAVAFIGEVILVSTAHLSGVIRQHATNLPQGQQRP